VVSGYPAKCWSTTPLIKTLNTIITYKRARPEFDLHNISKYSEKYYALEYGIKTVINNKLK